MDRDEIDALHAVGLAHTLMLSALMSVLREKGLLSQAELNTVFDSAITGAETASGISPEHAMRVRRLLEIVAGELAGAPRAQV